MRAQLLIIGLLIVVAGSYGFAQKSKPLSAQKVAADAAWPAFFKAFREAVTKRDREAMKKMMVKDFFFSGGGGDDNHDGDNRDEAFKFLDDPEVHGWQAFDKVLAKGAVPSQPNPNANGKKYLSRVAPPTAARIRDLSNAPPWIASFEYREGKWYCTSFSECCD